MKKFFIFLLLTITTTVFAQNLSNEEIYNLLKRNKKTLELSEEEILNSRISNSYYNTSSQTQLVYLQQQRHEIDIYKYLKVLAFKNNELVSNEGFFLANAKNLINVDAPTYTAAAAVAKVLTNRNNLPTQSILPVQVLDNGKKVLFTDLGICNEAIEAKLIYAPTTDKSVNLCWQIKYVPKNSADYLYVNIDAHSNTEIDFTNLTVYCNWSKTENDCNDNKVAHFHKPMLNNQLQNAIQSPLTINNASYRVVPYPYESPIHMPTANTTQVVNDPWLLAAVGNNATTLGWHSTDAATDYNYTRGNNVWAQEDRDNNDNTMGAADTSTTGVPFNFIKSYDFAQAPLVTVNQRAVTTNLFYWNNIIHDMMYQYGFTEAAGNFQFNNLSRGGLGNDHVVADAQDASGTDNANFGTPPDGSAPRMQMYVWTAATLDRDSDMDNGVIIHEYGHGISNRLTGGPSNTSCLANTEQMGEGWSDYFGLMLTTNWATAVMTDSVVSRPIGTYVNNQATTGAGIRTHPYNYRMSINPLTYTNVSTAVVPHGIGTIWATILWDMTWNLIEQDGFNTNLFDANAVGGNTAALKIVMEGLKLQRCTPGFVSGRNAILKADSLLYGGIHGCAIWKAFARRGVGALANEGLTTSRTDQTVNFDNKYFAYDFSQNVNQQQENNPITFTHTVQAPCAAISSAYVTDTLPTNVTYVSGGSYNTANRVVTFSGINLTQGQSQNLQLQVTVNTGTYTAPIIPLTDNVNSSTIDPIWTNTNISGTTSPWTTSNTQVNTGAFSLFHTNLGSSSNTALASSTIAIPSNTNKTQLSFWHWFSTEAMYDGGLVEISTNSGSTWTALRSQFVSGGYNVTMNSGSPFGAVTAFSGTSNGWKKVVVDLTSFAGQNVQIRFRFASDVTVGGDGWFIDDILVENSAKVFMNAQLFNNSNAKLDSIRTTASILPNTLPLRLLTFSVTKNNKDVLVDWRAETNLAASYYEIERSTTGIDFEKIGRVTSNTLNNQYSYIDVNISQRSLPFVYYRLKLVEQDGKTYYSAIKKVNFSNKNSYAIAPNPATNSITIFGWQPAVQKTNYIIVDAIGKVVKTGIINSTNNIVAINNLQNGVYAIKIFGSNTVENIRFVKQ